MERWGEKGGKREKNDTGQSRGNESGLLLQRVSKFPMSMVWGLSGSRREDGGYKISLDRAVLADKRCSYKD